MLTAVPARRMALVWLIAAAFSISLVWLLASPVRAATINVTTTADVIGVDGFCSLREAVSAAGTNAAVNECPAGSATETDTINLAAQTYTLAIAGRGEDAALTGDLDLFGGPIGIVGQGATATIIDGAALDRLFDLNDAAVVVSISGLTIRNGNPNPPDSGDSGGGIEVATGTLSLSGVAISGNSALFGGGIFISLGVVTITNSTVSGNTGVLSGGGISNDPSGTLTITNSTVSTNTTTGSWAGINNNGTTTITNSTIVANSAPAGQGGGLKNGFVQSPIRASLLNTIVANNTGGDCVNAATSLGNNLDSDGSCGLSASGDLSSTNPQLGPLTNNGGQTQTHALLAGSPAIDAGNNSGCPATDQRGVARPQDGDENASVICDIGAYELVPTPPTASITDVTVTEGNTGTTVEATFSVTLSKPSASAVTIAYATANGSATAPADYVAETGTVTFAAGDVSETLSVTVNGDALDEPNETFFVNLSAPVGATISDDQGTGTILDDDGPPALSINDVSVTEGNSGFVNATFTVRLLPAATGAVTVAYATANGTAIAPADYESASGTLTFAAGDTEETITVRVAGDTLDEVNETFVVNLSASTGATISDNQGTGNILDDEGPIVPLVPLVPLVPTPTPTPTPAAAALPDTATDAGASGGVAIGLLVLMLSSVALMYTRKRGINPN